jgi:hypothetical protein
MHMGKRRGTIAGVHVRGILDWNSGQRPLAQVQGGDHGKGNACEKLAIRYRVDNGSLAASFGL